MPYTTKEDRTEAVRRHREKKKTIALVMAKEAELRNYLRQLGFGAMSWDDLVEITEELSKDEKGNWHLKEGGESIYPPNEVYFVANTLIAW